jgi:putative hemolysin
MEVLILIGLIVLNGLFAMSEIALVTARKARLVKLAAEGDKSAAVAVKLSEDPTKFLSTVQIGITSIGVLSGIVGEAVLAKPLAIWLQGFGLEAATTDVVSTAIVVIGVTYVAIVIGELVPKRLGQLNPEVIARLVARAHADSGHCHASICDVSFLLHTRLVAHHGCEGEHGQWCD